MGEARFARGGAPRGGPAGARCCGRGLRDVDERLAAGTVLLRGGQEAEGTALPRRRGAGQRAARAARGARARRAEGLARAGAGRRARRHRYGKVAAAPGSLGREARLGQARCLRNAHQPDAMARMFRSIAADTAQATVAATALWEWAREYKALGRFAGADSALTLYIDRYPYGNDILAVLLTRGVARMMLNRPAAAEEDFRTLQRRADRRADKEQGAFWAARAALAQGRRAEALDILKGAVTWTLPDGYYGYRIRGFLKELEPSTELVPPYAPLTAERPGDPLRPAGLAELHPRCRAHFQRGLDLARGPASRRSAGRTGTRRQLASPTIPRCWKPRRSRGAGGTLYGRHSPPRGGPGRAGSSGEETRLWRHVYALGHFDLIGPAAATHQLDPMLVSGVIRQESLFEARAVSRAGARGLMQLMLPTARQMARASGNVMPDSEDLFRPEISVRYGTQYLRDKIAEFDGRVEVALAAYNAGEAKAREWAALLPAWDRTSTWNDRLRRNARYARRALATTYRAPRPTSRAGMTGASRRAQAHHR
jgi:soluble lytic murein transglycosylase